MNTVSISLTARDDQVLLVGALFGLTDYAYWLYITDLGGWTGVIPARESASA